MADEYEYKRLQDAMLLLGKKVSFYGAVSQFEQPKKTSAPGIQAEFYSCHVKFT